MFKFVGDGIDSGQKRQQAPKACEHCRRRKKRCNHLPPGQKARRTRTHRSVTSVNNGMSSVKSLLSPPATEVIGEGDLSQQSTPEDFAPHNGSKEANSQQSSELNPSLDARCHPDEATTNRSAAHQVLPDTRFIGDSNPEGIFLAATCATANRGTSMNGNIGVWLTPAQSSGTVAAPSSPPVLSPSDLFYGSSSIVRNVLAPLLEQECLSVLPLVTQVEALSKIYFEKVHPIFPVIDDIRYHNLPGSDPELILLQQAICLAASKNFVARTHLILKGSDQLLSCREFGDRLSAAMRLSIEMGLVKNKIILIQACALMSLFSDGPDAGEMSSQYCAKAVNHVQGMGMHIEPQQEWCWGDYGTTLLCCVWALDRLNSALNGRPLLIHERDSRQDFEQCIQRQEPCFRLFLQVIMLLDKVIGRYRPSVKPDPGVLDGIYPVFEDLVESTDCSQIGTASLATIEVLYHAVSILSCRSPVWSEPTRSSKSYLRQILSTSILSSTVARELRSHVVIFPFVPYALSLSLSIAYREMRYGKMTMCRIRARAQFQDIYDTISELDEVYRSASTTARRSRKLLAEMDRVVSTVTVPEQRKQDRNQPNVDHSVDNHDTTNAWDAGNDLAEPSATTNRPDLPVQPFQDFGPSYFDSTGDIDLFGMFDPAFNLDDFDACLESNLNPYLPSYGT